VRFSIDSEVEMNRTNRSLMCAVLLLPAFVSASQSHAQDAVPGEILLRTFPIRAAEQGTAFTIDHDGKVYLVTARHVAGALPAQGATVQIRQNGEWKDYKTVKTIYPKSDEVDIAIFETNEKIQKPYLVTAGGTAGATMGQQVWFLGYPFLDGMSSHFGKGGAADAPKEAPFIKRGTMSAVDGTNPDAVVVYIDGFNNPGFSGGPIVYWDFSTHTYAVLGVVKGYREENGVKAMVNGQQVDTQLLSNSGILVGYSIANAVDAIVAADAPTKK
jgi:hypothetical protein